MIHPLSTWRCNAAHICCIGSRESINHEVSCSQQEPGRDFHFPSKSLCVESLHYPVLIFQIQGRCSYAAATVWSQNQDKSRNSGRHPETTLRQRFQQEYLKIVPDERPGEQGASSPLKQTKQQRHRNNYSCFVNSEPGQQPPLMIAQGGTAAIAEPGKNI